VNFSEIKADVNGFFHFFSLFFRLCYKKDAFISSDGGIFHHLGRFVKGVFQEFWDILREGAVSRDIRDRMDASDVNTMGYEERLFEPRISRKARMGMKSRKQKAGISYPCNPW
jgi:hypothetical protein